jgi:hypothetical protein
MSLAWLTGALFGAQHVLTGPDHLAAVAPMSVGGRRAWRVGLAWGMGHASGVWLLAALVLGFGALLPLEAMSAWSERIVGLSVIAVGVWGLLRSRQPGHEHGGDARTPLAAAAVGSLHGLAGGSHLLGVLPGLPLSEEGDRLVYLVAFGAASVLTMLVVTSVMGSNLVRKSWRERAARASSWVAIGIGIGWLWAA